MEGAEMRTYTPYERRNLILSSLANASETMLLKYADRIDRLYAQYLEGKITGSQARLLLEIYQRLTFVESLRPTLKEGPRIA